MNLSWLDKWYHAYLFVLEAHTVVIYRNSVLLHYICETSLKVEMTINAAVQCMKDLWTIIHFSQRKIWFLWLLFNLNCWDTLPLLPQGTFISDISLLFCSQLHIWVCNGSNMKVDIVFQHYSNWVIRWHIVPLVI